MTGGAGGHGRTMFGFVLVRLSRFTGNLQGFSSLQPRRRCRSEQCGFVAHSDGTARSNPDCCRLSTAAFGFLYRAFESPILVRLVFTLNPLVVNYFRGRQVEIRCQILENPAAIVFGDLHQ